MRSNLYKMYALCFILAIGLCSCKKYLETKSVQTLSTPETLEDLQLLIDNPSFILDISVNNNTSDEFYIDEARWLSIPEIFNKSYVWDANLNNISDWTGQYNVIYYVNNILLNIDRVPTDGQLEKKNNIKGSALFFRGYSFYQIAQLFAPAYSASSSNSPYGIPLRLNANFNEPSVRSTIQQTYDQIIKDLEEALPLLPSNSLFKHRPNKAACYGFLARVYLQMGNYSKAKENADAFLQISNTLVDFKTLNSTNSFPLGNYNSNPEVIFYRNTAAGLVGIQSAARIDSTLYGSYQTNDLRKAMYFKSNGNGTYAFKGSYVGTATLFTGIATDEIYLIRAECYAREGNTSSALQDLNSLLTKRYDNTFVPLTAATADAALTLILDERKKELLARGVRWSDLKRLNQESRFAITLKRKLGALTFEFPPNDLRYTLLIPKEIIVMTNMEQNPR